MSDDVRFDNPSAKRNSLLNFFHLPASVALPLIERVCPLTPDSDIRHNTRRTER